jgi:hypothetical protein
LLKALEVTTNPHLKAALQAEAQQAQAAAAAKPAAALSTGEAHRRAEAAWREANRRHDQASDAVRKAKDQLQRAVEREEETVKQLAEAEIAKRIASRMQFMEKIGESWDYLEDADFEDIAEEIRLRTLHSMRRSKRLRQKAMRRERMQRAAE